MREHLDTRRLQILLQTREKLPLIYAGILSVEIDESYDDRIREYIRLWMDDQLDVTASVEGYCIEDAMDYYGISSLQALCLLNLQLMDPDAMERAEWYRREDRVD